MQLNYFSIWRNYLMNVVKIEDYSFEERIRLVEWFIQNYDRNEELNFLLDEFPFINVFTLIPSFFYKNEQKQILDNQLFDEKMRSYFIMNLTDEEKPFYFPSITSPNYQANIISSFTSDTLKEEYLKKVIGKYQRSIIIQSFQDDKIKERYLNELDGSEWIHTILSFQSDDVKVQYLSKIKESAYRLMIIESFQSDRKKIEYLKEEDWSLSDKISIICSFGDDDLKIEFLSQIQNKLYRRKLLSSLKTDPGRIQVLKILSNEEERSFVVEKIEDLYLRNSYLPDSQKIKDIAFVKNNTCYSYSIKGYEPFLLKEDMTFGIELEMVGRKANNLLLLNDRRLLKRWEIKTEEIGINGLEVTSPILHYQLSDMNELYNICAFLKKNDFEVTQGCAGHIHVGSHTLDTVQAFKMFYYLYLNCERILYLISNEPGTLPRSGFMRYARPISSDFQDYVSKEQIDFENIHDVDTFIKEIQKFQFQTQFEDGRNRGVNVLNINNGSKRKNTIEFRIPNGSLNPDMIHENIKLFGSLVLTSKKLTQTKITKEKKKILSLLGSSSKEIEKVQALLSLLFEDLEDRMIFLERYLTNSALLEKDDVFNRTNFSAVKRM